MSQMLIQSDTLTDIADAIRAKGGSTDTFLPSEMADAISQISTEPTFNFVSDSAKGSTPSIKTTLTLNLRNVDFTKKYIIAVGSNATSSSRVLFRNCTASALGFQYVELGSSTSQKSVSVGLYLLSNITGNPSVSVENTYVAVILYSPL